MGSPAHATVLQPFELFDFQDKLKKGIYDLWDAGLKHVLGVMPTGAGKTVVMARIVRENKGACCVIAHRQELVGQISMALAREGIYHRIIGPDDVVGMCTEMHIEEFGQSFYNCNAQTAVAGVDTLNARAKELQFWAKNITLWLMDEAHHVLAENKWGKALRLFKNARGLGVTATPCRSDKKGLSRTTYGVFDQMVLGPSMRELIQRGFLTDYEIALPDPRLIMDDKKDVGSTGDYKKNVVRLKFKKEKNKIIGDLVEHYQRLANGTLAVAFVPDVDDAIDTAAAFTAAGIPSMALSARNTDRERREALKKFAKREILVLVNVDLFGEGFDLPALETVIMGRPTMSLGLFMQQCGRALRKMKGKAKALIIDHVGNFWKHGAPDKERFWNLDGGKPLPDEEENETEMKVKCTNPFCNRPFNKFLNACPYCGQEKPKPKKRAAKEGPEPIDGELELLTPEQLAELRGYVTHFDRSPEQYRDEMIAKHTPRRFVNTHVERFEKDQINQEYLRDSIARWGALQREIGLKDEESQRKFSYKFGVNVLAAQSLKTKDSVALNIKICQDIMKELKK